LAKRDYYSTLQLNPSASQEAIEAAYARLRKIYDPNASKKPRATERWQEIEEAYAVLSDKKRRAEYDRLRARGWRPGQPQEPERELKGIWAWLGNPFIFAGSLACGVLIIVVGIVLFSLAGGGEARDTDNLLTDADATPAGRRAPTTAPDSPPEVSGEEAVTETGLRYIDIAEGEGPSPNEGDAVVVDYTGWLEAGGAKFDSSLERPEPYQFVLGAGSVIPGWEEGVATMKVGGKRRLIVPPEHAYGDQGFLGVIPPNATLIFDIELLDILPAIPIPPATPAEGGAPGDDRG
jgi:peptidylprolyl isomerase